MYLLKNYFKMTELAYFSILFTAMLLGGAYSAPATPRTPRCHSERRDRIEFGTDLGEDNDDYWSSDDEMKETALVFEKGDTIFTAQDLP